MLRDRFSNLEIMNLIKDCEAKYPVDTWVIGGVHIWPVIRNNFPFLFIRFGSSKDNNFKVNESLSVSILIKIKKFFSFISHAFSSVLIIFNLWINKKPCKVMFVGDGVAKTPINNVWVDRFIDPLCHALEEKNEAALLLEQLSFRKTPTLNNYTTLESIEKVSYYLARLLTIFSQPSNENVGYQDFLQSVNQYNIGHHISEKDLIVYIMQVKICAYVFDLVIKWYRIKDSYIVCYYGTLGYSLALSARRNNISITDIEHGSILNCPAYCEWSKVPKNGYDLLPTNFSLWHYALLDVMTESNSENFLSNHQINVDGISFIDYMKSNNNPSEKISSIFKDIKKIYKKLVVVTLQPQFYGLNDWDRLADEIIKNGFDFAWWIRSHPGHGNTKGMEKILSIDRSNVYYDDGAIPLYLLFECADHLVTTASAAALEAVIFKIPIIFISQTGREDFDILIRNNLATYIDKTSSIIDRIRLG